MYKLRNFLKITLITSLILSCTNLAEDGSSKTFLPAQDGKGYISVGVANQDNSSRTLLPKIEISNLALKGGVNSAGQTVLAAADSLEEMNGRQIAVQTGDWNFTLTAIVSGVPFSSETLSTTIASGSQTFLSFTLEPEGNPDFGIFDFTIIPTGREGINYYAEIFLDNETEMLTSASFISGQKLNYILTPATGTHTILAKFYAEDADNSGSLSEVLNSYKSIVRIKKGITTKATVENFNLNEIYSISYEGYDTSEDSTGSEKLIYKFSRKSGDSDGFITLPKLSNSNMTFSGWWDENGKLVQCYDDSGAIIQCYDDDGTLIHDYAATDIQKFLVKDNFTDFNLYAKWLAEGNGKVSTPLDYKFTFEPGDIFWGIKGKEQTVTLTPKLTAPATISYSDISDDLRLKASLWNGKDKVLDLSPGTDFKITIPALNYAETYTLKITATCFNVEHSAAFEYKTITPQEAHSTPQRLPSETNGTAGTSATYIYFGDFPQTEKASSVTINKEEAKTQGSYTYYLGNDSYWYAEVSDKYYKVEPIKWRLLDTSYDHDGNAATAGKCLLLAENILITKSFGLASGNNKYKESLVRTYLTDEFYQTAFTNDAQNKILTSFVDNSLTSTGDSSNPWLCDNTDDKIFILSRVDVKNSNYFSGDSARQKKRTDFANANSPAPSGEKTWWTRTPTNESASWAYRVVRLVLGSGGISEQGWQTYEHDDVGVAPALCIDSL